MPSNAFFNLFHKQKKFSGNDFTKLRANPLLACITEDSTNYFSVLYQIQKLYHLPDASVRCDQQFPKA